MKKEVEEFSEYWQTAYRPAAYLTPPHIEVDQFLEAVFGHSQGRLPSISKNDPAASRRCSEQVKEDLTLAIQSDPSLLSDADLEWLSRSQLQRLYDVYGFDHLDVGVITAAAQETIDALGIDDEGAGLPEVKFDPSINADLDTGDLVTRGTYSFSEDMICIVGNIEPEPADTASLKPLTVHERAHRSNLVEYLGTNRFQRSQEAVAEYVGLPNIRRQPYELILSGRMQGMPEIAKSIYRGLVIFEADAQKAGERATVRRLKQAGDDVEEQYDLSGFVLRDELLAQTLSKGLSGTFDSGSTAYRDYVEEYYDNHTGYPEGAGKTLRSGLEVMEEVYRAQEGSAIERLKRIMDQRDEFFDSGWEAYCEDGTAKRLPDPMHS